MNSFFEQNNLEKFYADHPDSIVFAFLAAKYIESGMTQKARTIAEDGVRKHPSYAFGQYVLGLCYYRLNDLARAKDNLELSIADDDKNLQAWKLLGDINEELELPQLSRDNSLKYYLLDPFNKEAANEFQQSEMMQLNEFETMQLEGDLPEGGGDEDAYQRTEASLEELFEVDMDDTEELDISQKVDEVFKETLGDFSFDREETVHDEVTRPVIEDDVPTVEDFDNIDIFDDDDDAPELPQFDLPDEPSTEETLVATFDTDDDALQPESKQDSAADSEDDFEDIDIVSELDDFFSEYEIEDIGEEKEDEIDKDDMNFGNILFSESKSEDEEKPKEPDVDLLDYSSMVEEIITDDEENTGERHQDTSDENDTAYSYEPDEVFPDESQSQPEYSESHPEQESSPQIPSASGNAARFGRPPILSPTLGEIYISQGRFEEAIDVFQQLLEKDPDNSRFQKKIKDIRSMLDRQKS